MPKHSVAATVLLLAFAHRAGAEIQQIGPFEGDLFEGFESYGLTFEPELDVFAGQVTLSGTSGSPAIYVVASSTIEGRTVFPHSGGWLGGGGEPVDWLFHIPATKFGGYFATNSNAPDAVADFFDLDDNLIESLIVSIPGDDQSWLWNGWMSDVPVKRIRITGNGINNGFIDYDDMQLTPVPEPTSLALLALAAGALFRRRIKSSSAELVYEKPPTTSGPSPCGRTRSVLANRSVFRYLPHHRVHPRPTATVATAAKGSLRQVRVKPYRQRSRPLPGVRHAGVMDLCRLRSLAENPTTISGLMVSP